jgi:hypothetical protein
MLSVPRSVTTSVAPSALKAICAGSASAPLSGRDDPSSSASRPSRISKPAMLDVALLST